MMFFTQINFEQRKKQEKYREINSRLANTSYTSKLNNWEIRFVYRLCK